MSLCIPSPELRTRLIGDYGLVVGGSDLVKLLGFRTYRGFYSAYVGKRLPVPVFEIPGRKGRFARTEDVAKWFDLLSQ
jgi:hypothetical protein